uniref:Schlafen AlbA-2 domain-containing protein n=1 Tax=Candidatus Kentrum sp. FW TaxID=2126338 RepID=A0A450U3Z3_9GAMM|nr:MAG: hypothetical protein BECKFW1821C_GA0114237_11551 [Candidatus Kentron sp. FW]
MSTILPIDTRRLLYLESARVEFKGSWDEKTTGLQVLHTLCAFANDFQNLGGGYIVLGVAAPQGQAILPPAGLDPNTIEDIQRWVRGKCNTPDPVYQPVMSPAGRTYFSWSHSPAIAGCHRLSSHPAHPAPTFDFNPERTFFRVTLPAHPEYVAISALRDAAHPRAIGDEAGALGRLAVLHGALDITHIGLQELSQPALSQHGFKAKPRKR